VEALSALAFKSIFPPKHTNLVARVHRLIEQQRYIATSHAKKRLDKREISMKEVRAVLVSGKRASERDEFHTHDDAGREINRWSYAFTKQGLDRKLRVCVSLLDDVVEKQLLVVTVIDET
jgi:hypothetical protein